MVNAVETGVKKLRPWQEETVGRFADEEAFAINADCSCGKTLTAIEIAIAKDMPVIVIAPGRRLCEQWKNDILKDAGPDEDVWLYSKPDETAEGESYMERFRAWLKS
jgi:superfamily II DNA or RNA helicase